MHKESVLHNQLTWGSALAVNREVTAALLEVSQPCWPRSPQLSVLELLQQSTRYSGTLREGRVNNVAEASRSQDFE